MPLGVEVKLRAVEVAQGPSQKHLKPRRPPANLARVQGLPSGENEPEGLWTGGDPDVPGEGGV